MTCIAPRCGSAREPGSLFCRGCEQAPAAQRGGWLSAEKRRRRLAGTDQERLDASNVERRLWVGGKPPFDRDLPFDVLVLCAEELQPPSLAFQGSVLRCPLPDGQLDTLQVSRVVQTARIAAQHWMRGQRVLVTCAQGINRSALVASFTLAFVSQRGADELIQLMRAKRHPQALYNPHFQALMQRLIGSARYAVRRR
jgi:hypothetical protein